MSAQYDPRLDGTRPPGDKAAVVRALSPLVGKGALLHDEESLRPYECDGLSAYRSLPLAVVLPETTAQVQAILTACGRLGVPVVARGAGTGLSGGAMPLEDGVLLAMAKFNRILDVDPANRVARVQPGVTNLDVSRAAAAFGLHYAPDPSSQIACTIGGNVAENAGGVHCLKYGLTVHNVCGVELITMSGERIALGGAAPDAPGLDLLAVITGSEGMLGVITEVTVKLLPVVETARVLMAAFDDVARAGNAVAAVIAAGIVPAGLEMMDNAIIGAAEDFVQAGYPRDAEAILLCELDGTEPEVHAGIEQVEAILARAGAVELRVARDDNERARFWSGRKNAFPAVSRIAPDYYCMDGTIPRRELASVLPRIREMAVAHGLAVANVFHAGDGNLHPLILYDANLPGQLEAAEGLGGEILELCVAAGGTITGEHGVGREKINQMCAQFSPEEIAQFHALKEAFDPDRLLNPGKAIPTLARCAEFGRMHVHAGKLPFPDLERF